MPIKQTVLVVGGAGFIGSHMVLSLRAAGFTPVVLDNLSTGHADAVLDAECIVGDCADSLLLDRLFTTYHFTAVMHFASCIEVAESTRLPMKYYRNNVAAAVTLLEKVLQHRIPHFIFSSSASVYGEPRYIPIDEQHPLNPLHPYGRSKAMVEAMLQDAGQSDGLKYAILRYFNAAGCDPLGRLRERHMPESHLIPLVLQVAQGLLPHLTVYGNDYPTADGTGVRDYVHVSDLCHAHVLALQALLDGKPSLLCNLGRGEGLSVKHIIETARKLTHRTIPVHFAKRRSGDPAILVADITAAQNMLGWQPHYRDVETMMRHVLFAFQDTKLLSS